MEPTREPTSWPLRKSPESPYGPRGDVRRAQIEAKLSSGIRDNYDVAPYKLRAWTEGEIEDLTPEQHLLIATILQAVEDVVTPMPKVRLSSETSLKPFERASNILRDAIEWLCSESERPWSFRWVCINLGLDPDVAWLALEDLCLRIMK